MPFFQLELDSDYLPYPIVAEIGVLRRKRCRRINPRDSGFERAFGGRIEIDASGLAYADAANLPFGDESTQVDFAEVNEGNNWCSRRDDFSRLGDPCNDRTAKRGNDFEVAAIGRGFPQLGASPLGCRLGLLAGHVVDHDGPV